MSVFDAAIHPLMLRVVSAAALHPRPFPFSFALRAICGIADLRQSSFSNGSSQGLHRSPVGVFDNANISNSGIAQYL